MSSDTDKNKIAAAAFGDASGQDGLALFNPDIVDYATADGERKTRMDALITTLEAAIAEDDLTVITSFDKEPSDTLGKTSETILREVQSANSFLGSFKEFGEKLKSFDFDGVGKMAKDYSASIQRNIQLAAIKSPITRFFKKAVNWVLGIGKKDTTGDDLRHAIDQSILEFGQVIAELEKAKDKIPGLSKKLDKQEDARIEAYSEYGLYIGAAQEVYRRMKQDTIPALEAKAKNSGSLLDSRNVSAKKLANTVLNKKLTSMDTFHKSCLVQLETIGDLKGALTMSELNINSHLTTSKNEWLAFLSESTSAATLSEIAEANQKADQFGDKIFEQAQTLSDITTQMSRACFEHGTLDAGLVAGFLNKKKVQLLEGVQFMEEVNTRFEAKRAALDAAAADLLRAKAEVNSGADVAAAQAEIKLLTDQRANRDTVTIDTVTPAEKAPVLKK